jgi:FixJ family two-component response regulator
MLRDAPNDARTDAARPASLVYVIDDDEAVRDSLKWLLEANRYQVISFARAEDFLNAYDGTKTACLILDVRMPGMSGLELQEQLVARDANLPILFITGHGDVPMAVSTMKRGAVDFIEKPFNEGVLRASVERMLIAAEREAEVRRRGHERDSLLARLTARERQVLDCIVAGRLNKQIADDLGISIKTVEAHRANIMDKLNAGTVADLLRLALSNG